MLFANISKPKHTELVFEPLERLSLPVLKIISWAGPGYSSGVVANLVPLARQLGTTVHWLALSGIPLHQNKLSEDEQIHNFVFHRSEAIPKLVESSTLILREYLWPLLHGMKERMPFDNYLWRSFRQLSESIAIQSLTLASSQKSIPTIVWLQDFEMALVVPHLFMEATVILSHFWHAPWPKPAFMAASPIASEICEALLANKLLGFHTLEYAYNFLATIQQTLPLATVDIDNMQILYKAWQTKVVAMPLGIDFVYWQQLAKASYCQADVIKAQHQLVAKVVLAVDRLDYTKGILERLAGLDDFLTRHPQWHGQFHYVQLLKFAGSEECVPSDYHNVLKNKVDAINKKYGSAIWQPIIWLEKVCEHRELAAWYQVANVLAVTPICDGLNLIAKEYVASRLDEQGVLILSNQTGAMSELRDGAIIVSPFSANEVAAALHYALTMDSKEQQRRMRLLFHAVERNRLSDWAYGFLRQALTI